MISNDEEETDKLTDQNLRKLFEVYSKTGDDTDENSEGILFSQIDFWMGKAKLFSSKLTIKDTGIAYIKFRHRRLTYEEFMQFLQSICEANDIEIENLKQKLGDADTILF